MCERFKRAIGAQLFLAVLVLSSSFVIGEMFMPYSHTLNQNYFKLPEAILATFASVMLMSNKESVSSFYLHLLFLLMFVPLGAMFVLTDGDRWWFYLNTCFWVLLFFIHRLSLPHKVSLGFWFSDRLVAVLLVAFVLLVLFQGLRKYGVSFVQSFSEVYEVRQSYKASLSVVLVYLFNWSAYILLPFLIVKAVANRSALLLVVASLASFLFFSFTGMKAYLLAPVVAVGAVYISATRWGGSWLGLSLAGLVVVSSALYVLFGDIWALALFVNRALLLPADISFNYYEYFSTNQPLYFSQSFLSGILPAHFEQPVPIVIGEEYYATGNYANGGMVADVYVQGRAAAIFMLALLLGYLMRYLEYLELKIGRNQLIGLFVMPILFLVNGPFVTAFLTGGLLLSLVLANLVSRR